MFHLAPHLVAFFTPHLAFVTPLVVLHATVFLTVAAVVVVVRARNTTTAAQPQKGRCQNRCDAYQGLHGCSFGPDSRTREHALAFNPNVANVNDRGARDSRRNLQ
jgi:hypothetical protein